MLVLVTHIAVHTYQSDCERLHNTQHALQQTALEAFITSCLGVKRVSTATVYVQWQGIDSAWRQHAAGLAARTVKRAHSRRRPQRRRWRRGGTAVGAALHCTGSDERAAMLRARIFQEVKSLWV
jgi:hypothetical protein